jgi:hypothetical protein
LALRVALEREGSDVVTLTGLAAFYREPIMVRCAVVATKRERKNRVMHLRRMVCHGSGCVDLPKSDNPFPTIALPIPHVAGPIEGANRVAHALLTPLPARQVIERVLALVALPPNHIGLAGTLARGLLADQFVLVRGNCAEVVAFAGFAVAFGQGQSITEESRQTIVTPAQKVRSSGDSSVYV